MHDIPQITLFLLSVAFFAFRRSSSLRKKILQDTHDLNTFKLVRTNCCCTHGVGVGVGWKGDSTHCLYVSFVRRWLLTTTSIILPLMGGAILFAFINVDLKFQSLAVECVFGSFISLQVNLILKFIIASH